MGSARNDRVIVYRSAVTTLPMDARMTGIYLGAAATVVWLIAARRLRAARTPSLPVLVLLASFVVALAVDGFNAFFVDLRLPTMYEPSNLIRIATGVLAGIALGLALGYLFAVSVWAHGDRERAVVMKPVELLAPTGVLGGDCLDRVLRPAHIVCAVCGRTGDRRGRCLLAPWDSSPRALIGPWLVVPNMERSSAAGSHIVHRRHHDHRRALRATFRSGAAVRASQIDIVRDIQALC